MLETLTDWAFQSILALLHRGIRGEYCDRSVSLGKYCRSRPLVFSLVGRCHAAQSSHQGRCVGRLIILEGRLRYCLEDGSGRSWMLDSDTPAWIPPDLPHRVEFIGPVRFYVSFWH